MAFDGSEMFSMVNIEGSAINEDSSQGAQAQGHGNTPDPEPKQQYLECCSMSTTFSEKKREMMWRAQSLTLRKGAYVIRFRILGMDVVQVQPKSRARV